MIFVYRVTGMSLDHMFCSRCREGFVAHEKIVNSHGELWHPQCFVLVTYIMKKMYDL